MTWVTVDQFKSRFSPAEDAKTDQVQMALDAAEDELVELVGQTAVTDAKLVSPVDTVRAGKLIRGHQFLSFSIFIWNRRDIKKATDAGSPGMGGSSNIVNEWWNPNEIEKASNYWRGLALKALAAYLITDVAGDEYGAGVEYSHPVLTACCDQ